MDKMTSTHTVYVVSLDGLDLGTCRQFETDIEADKHNRQEFNGHGTMFELTTQLDWSNAVRVEEVDWS